MTGRARRRPASGRGRRRARSAGACPRSPRGARRRSRSRSHESRVDAEAVCGPGHGFVASHAGRSDGAHDFVDVRTAHETSTPPTRTCAIHDPGMLDRGQPLLQETGDECRHGDALRDGPTSEPILEIGVQAVGRRGCHEPECSAMSSDALHRGRMRTTCVVLEARQDAYEDYNGGRRPGTRRGRRGRYWPAWCGRTCAAGARVLRVEHPLQVRLEAASAA